EVRRAASLVIQQQVMARPEFQAARTVALYVSIDGEVETAELVAAALAAGKTVVLPAVAGQSLVFRQVDATIGLVCGAFGICEPPTEAWIVPIANIDLFVIPGVGFDLAGRRLGYGKGYYDRALHAFEGAGRLMGICYDFQLVAEIVGEPHDVQMDLVVTEQRVVCPCSFSIKKGVQQ
ncbi:MAG TPA: 5-formyltetrahydrofolate cyclo-ligase, partial [Geobacteraceae bacterium]